MLLQEVIKKWENVRIRVIKICRNYEPYRQHEELFVVDSFIEDLKSMEKGGDKMNEMTEGTKKGVNEVGKVNNMTEELTALSTDILELTLGIEHFFVGKSPLCASEKQDKMEPMGWYQAHWDKLNGIKNKLCLVANSLRAVKSESE